MTQAAVNPTLPQNDTPAQQQARAAQLAETRSQYQWTTEVPTLPGVPLAKPLSSDKPLPTGETPTLSWFIILIGVGLQIARNEIAFIIDGLEQDISAIEKDIEKIVARLDGLEATVSGITNEYGPHKGGNFLDRGITAIENAIEDSVHDAHVKTLHDQACTLKSIVEAIVDLLKLLGAKTPSSLGTYLSLFNTLPVPGIAYNFQDDATFARLRVAGPNPMLIKCIDALPGNFPVTDAQYAAAVNGDSLQDALSDGRVFLSDYAELEVLIEGMWDGKAKYIYRPMALFAVPPGGASLVPVAIQCGQDPEEFPIFTPSVKADAQWGWETAKLAVQVADGNYHELFVHLARTHLIMEAFAVATHRNLAEVHPIWGLLVPHFEGSLFISYEAATSLIAADGPIDHIFAGTISTSQLAAAQDRLGFDFSANMVPTELAARGVDDQSKLADYPYRDDALLVWQAIREWVAQYVQHYYSSDEEVAGDTELAAWAASLKDEGLVKGLPDIATRSALIDTCTMAIFTASAQHAAVNFPQKDIMAFAPNVTGAGWAAAPQQQAGHDKAEWLTHMPPLSLALEQLNTLWLLGSVHYRPLGTYLSTDYVSGQGYKPWFQDPAVTGKSGLLAHFNAQLQQVESEIVARNSARRNPYIYLQPSLIPTSINI